MFFNRNKPHDDLTLSDAEMTPGMKEKIDDMVKGWGEVTRGLRDAKPDLAEPPLQIVRQADVAYLLSALEDEGSRIEAEIEERRKSFRAEIAQKDAERASLLRQKERIIADTQAKLDAQQAQIERRGDARAALLHTIAKIDPAFDASSMLKDADIRREVVRRKFGDASVADRSEAYIDERFELLAGRASVDPFALVVADGIVATGGSLDALRRGAEDAYTKCVDDLRNAHKRRD